ncbi:MULTISPECIES: glucosamine-6-phosphate deaminase [Aerococcus]|uniref:Glucosamine-6-phosphate deaminase n=1 Tax=Aerococcus tenax TaxID=3078812 RepID=A0A5N1BJI9_9LACT|nr:MULTISPECIES: glucosamine-6-phosphate deaminase [Aerococcus]KAA9239766.1 glucosamine-6-phosphate deaminase [Aerococcus urinae]MDK6370588.1 glucosamine-6-phosphate deaminase [Aerococcus urinae]MDK6596740.1 glucosamine-6-phosphate deaminase [Aerococcus urinae]MDK7302204.1 glucosamine-6-phosphate deaminase [Aerococcus urinae]MDK7800845.1 glucosamine-6-phosphate deaminase [Aerococcus urinae]
MKVYIYDDIETASQAALNYYQEALADGPKVFGLATGSTPEKLYQEIVASDLDFTDSLSFNLDEYVGLEASHPQSYNYFMHKHLFNEKPFKHNYLLNGANPNEEEECSQFENLLQEHPIDLQLLGIGRNGHIGFNEPGSSFTSKTRKIELTESTIEANSRLFDSPSDVPTAAYSMGIGSILNSKNILLLAFGEEKAAAVKAMVEGPVTEEVPASALQKHPNVVVILDQAAASQLSGEADA